MPTWPTKPSPSWPIFERWTWSVASSSISAPAPAIPPITRPREWIERYRGHFDKGWDRWREETFARQLETGVLAPGTELSPRPPWVPAWDDLPERERQVAARFMECFAAYLSYTDDQLGRVLSFLERDRRPAGHPRDPGVRQRRQLRGWRHRFDQRQPPPEHGPRWSRRAGPPDRRARGAERPQQLPVGLDHGRQHAVQAVEARGPRGRGGRPLHRELAGPPGGGWGRPATVHPCRRHPAHRARPGRGRGAGHHRLRAPDPHRRHQLRPTPRPGR